MLVTGCFGRIFIVLNSYGFRATVRDVSASPGPFALCDLAQGYDRRIGIVNLIANYRLPSDFFATPNRHHVNPLGENDYTWATSVSKKATGRAPAC